MLPVISSSAKSLKISSSSSSTVVLLRYATLFEGNVGTAFTAVDSSSTNGLELLDFLSRS